jgi:hypothetical protein
MCVCVCVRVCVCERERNTCNFTSSFIWHPHVLLLFLINSLSRSCTLGGGDTRLPSRSSPTAVPHKRSAWHCCTACDTTEYHRLAEHHRQQMLKLLHLIAPSEAADIPSSRGIKQFEQIRCQKHLQSNGRATQMMLR